MPEKRRVVLVTGSSRGIGATLVHRFAQKGYCIVINYLRSEQAAIALRDSIIDEHGRDVALAARADVANRSEVWATVIGTILTGTFICSQEFAFRYTGDEGHIVNIGGLTAIRGRKDGANYCSACAGILALTKCLALELAPRIRVNCVTPGFINTDEVMERYQLHRQGNLDRALGTIPLSRLGTYGFLKIP